MGPRSRPSAEEALNHQWIANAEHLRTESSRRLIDGFAPCTGDKLRRFSRQSACRRSAAAFLTYANGVDSDNVDLVHAYLSAWDSNNDGKLSRSEFARALGVE